MTHRRDTLSQRVERAKKEMESWDSRLLASMQLQGATDAHYSLKQGSISSFATTERDTSEAVPSEGALKSRG